MKAILILQFPFLPLLTIAGHPFLKAIETALPTFEYGLVCVSDLASFENLFLRLLCRFYTLKYFTDIDFSFLIKDHFNKLQFKISQAFIMETGQGFPILIPSQTKISSINEIQYSCLDEMIDFNGPFSLDITIRSKSS